MWMYFSYIIPLVCRMFLYKNLSSSSCNKQLITKVHGNPDADFFLMEKKGEMQIN